jgi:hypothetical protein
MTRIAYHRALLASFGTALDVDVMCAAAASSREMTLRARVDVVKSLWRTSVDVRRRKDMLVIGESLYQMGLLRMWECSFDFYFDLYCLKVGGLNGQDAKMYQSGFNFSIVLFV